MRVARRKHATAAAAATTASAFHQRFPLAIFGGRGREFRLRSEAARNDKTNQSKRGKGVSHPNTLSQQAIDRKAPARSRREMFGTLDAGGV